MKVQYKWEAITSLQKNMYLDQRKESTKSLLWHLIVCLSVEMKLKLEKQSWVQEGEYITIITYGSGVHWALEYQRQHIDVSLHILDLRTLLPLDYNAIREAVATTGKVLILHEDTLTGGIGGEISAWIGEHCFELLDAPVMRCASLDTPIPFNMELEQNFMAKSRLHEYVQRLMEY